MGTNWLSPRGIAGAACGIALFAGQAGPAKAARCPDADLLPTTENLSRVEGALVCLINRERRHEKRSELRVARRLERSAGAHTRDMVTRGYFSHHAEGRPFLIERLDKVRYFQGAFSGFYAENLGFGPPERGSAATMHHAFMLSEYHRRNLLYKRFRDIGIGSRMIDPHPAFYPDWPAIVLTIDFGRRYVHRKDCSKRRRRSAGGREVVRARGWCQRKGAS